MTHPIFHMELQCTKCTVDVLLNGFPVASLTPPDDQPAWFAPPINPYLSGELNIVDVTIRPVVRGGVVSTFSDAEVAGWVRQYEKGGIVAPGEGPAVAEFGIPEELVERVREEELELPQSFSFVFSNDVVDFSDELGEPAPIDDAEALRDYAIRLRDLASAGNVGALVQELGPKLDAWVRAYDEPRPLFEQSLTQELGEMIGEGLELEFGRDEVEVLPWCGGRIWELQRRGGIPLLRTVEQPDESRSQYPIFAALRDGQLRVVR